uniref:Palmitoyltransferase n=1 Tax=Sinocyclocheilus rhinocerous TaxID=307959 RepID=A0A673JHQ1_9TELE
MKNREYQQIDPQALATPPPRPLPEHMPKRVRRKWEMFPGKNRFCCDGRMIVARQSGVLPLTLGLILLTSGLFFIFDCPFLVKHLTSCIPAIGGVLFVFVIISLLQTSFTDPGILPRATPEEAADIEKQIGEGAHISSGLLVVVELEVFKKLSFKHLFDFIRVTAHCRVCLTERFDHHCPWVGNCVGKRNYRFFYTFIVSLSFLTAFIFGCVTTHLALRSQGGNGLVFALQFSFTFFTALELVVCFFSVWSILGLSGFHTYLVAANLTTNEDIKGSCYNSIIKNCCSVLCGPMPPSLIDRRGFVPSDDSVQTSPVEIELPAAKNDRNMVGRAVTSGRPPPPPPPVVTLQQPAISIQSHSTA